MLYISLKSNKGDKKKIVAQVKNTALSAECIRIENYPKTKANRFPFISHPIFKVENLTNGV